MRRLPPFPDLRAFLDHTTAQGDLARIAEPVSLRHEMTAVQLAALRRGGPVLRFDAHDGPAMPVIANLFGTRTRAAAGLGRLPARPGGARGWGEKRGGRRGRRGRGLTGGDRRRGAAGGRGRRGGLG